MYDSDQNYMFVQNILFLMIFVVAAVFRWRKFSNFNNLTWSLMAGTNITPESVPFKTHLCYRK